MGTPTHIGRPMGADGERTRQRIKSAAMNHIAEVGYANATMKAIAQEADLTSAAIYHYFKSKESLVVNTLVSVLDESMARLGAAADRENDLIGRLNAILEEAIACVEDYPSLTRFESSIAFETHSHPDLSAVRQRRSEAETSLYLGLVDDAVASGELSPNVDRQSLIDVLLSITSGLTYLSATVSADRHRAAIRAFESILAGGLPVVRE